MGPHSKYIFPKKTTLLYSHIATIDSFHEEDLFGWALFSCHFYSYHKMLLNLTKSNTRPESPKIKSIDCDCRHLHVCLLFLWFRFEERSSVLVGHPAAAVRRLHAQM